MARVLPFIRAEEDVTIEAQRLIPYSQQNHGNNLYAKDEPEDQTSTSEEDIATVSCLSEEYTDEKYSIALDIDLEKEKGFGTEQICVKNVSTGTEELILKKEIKGDDGRNGCKVGCKESEFLKKSESEDKNSIVENNVEANMENQELFSIPCKKRADTNDEASRTLVLDNEACMDEVLDVEELVEGLVAQGDCMGWTEQILAERNKVISETNVMDKNIDSNDDSDSDTIEYFEEGIRSVECSESETRMDIANETQTVNMMDKSNEIDTGSDQVKAQSESKMDSTVKRERKIDAIVESENTLFKDRPHRIADEREFVDVEDCEMDDGKSFRSMFKSSGSPDKSQRISRDNASDQWREGGAVISTFKPKVESDQKPKTEIIDNGIKTYRVNTEHCSNDSGNNLNWDPHGLTLYRNLKTVDSAVLDNEKDKCQNDECGIGDAREDAIVPKLLELLDGEITDKSRNTGKRSLDDKMDIENNADIMVTGFNAPRKSNTTTHIKDPPGVRSSCRYGDKPGDESRNIQKSSVADNMRIEDDDEVMVTGYAAPRNTNAIANIKDPTGGRKSCRYKPNISYAESDPESDKDEPFVIEDDDDEIMQHAESSHQRKKRRKKINSHPQENQTITAFNSHNSVPGSQNHYPSHSTSATSWRGNIWPAFGAFPQCNTNMDSQHRLYDMPQSYPCSVPTSAPPNRVPPVQSSQVCPGTKGTSNAYGGPRTGNEYRTTSQDPLQRLSTPRDSVELLLANQLLKQQFPATAPNPVSVNQNSLQLPSQLPDHSSHGLTNPAYLKHSYLRNPGLHSSINQQLPYQPNFAPVNDQNPGSHLASHKDADNQLITSTPAISIVRATNQNSSTPSTLMPNLYPEEVNDIVDNSTAMFLDSNSVLSRANLELLLNPSTGNTDYDTNHHPVSSTDNIDHNPVVSTHDTDNPLVLLTATFDNHPALSTANIDHHPAPSTRIPDHLPGSSTASMVHHLVQSTADTDPVPTTEISDSQLPDCQPGLSKMSKSPMNPLTCAIDVTCNTGPASNDGSNDSEVHVAQANTWSTHRISSMPQEDTSVALPEDLPSHISLANKHGINTGFHPYTFNDSQLGSKVRWLLERCFMVKSDQIFIADKRYYADHCQRTMIAMFICNTCGGIFDSDKALGVHKQVTLQCLKHPQDVFHVICKVKKGTGEQSNVISPLVKRVLHRTDEDNSANTEGYVISCKGCSEKFTSTGDAVVHVGRAHLRRSYMYCHLCGTILCSKESFLKHLRMFHPEMVGLASGIHPCHCCHQNFNTECSLQEHYRKVHGDPFLCQICGKQLLSVGQLLEHLLQHCDHSQPTLAQCPVCGNAFDFRFFGNHMLAKHTNSDISYNHSLHKYQSIRVKCDFCDKIYSDSEITLHRLNGHCSNVVISTDANNRIKQWGCKKCQIMTTSFHEWRQHADMCASSSQMTEGVTRSVVWPIQLNLENTTMCLICCLQIPLEKKDAFRRHLNSHSVTLQTSDVTHAQTVAVDKSPEVLESTVSVDQPMIVQQASLHSKAVHQPTSEHNPHQKTMTKADTMKYLHVSTLYANIRLGKRFGQKLVMCEEMAHNKNLHFILDRRVFFERFKVMGDFHTCSVCGGIFFDAQSLEKHIEDVKTHMRHPQDAFHFIQQVDEDGLLKPVASKLVSIIAGTHDNNCEKDRTTTDDRCKFKCSSCQSDFKSVGEAINHVGRFHYSCPYMFCDLCGTVLSDSVSLISHATKFHMEKIGEYMKIVPCSVCPENFTEREQCLEHIKKCHSDKELSCKWCTKAVTSQHELTLHRLGHDQDESALAVCPVCGDRLSYDLLGDHILRYHSQRWGLVQPLPNIPHMSFNDMRANLRIKCDFCDSSYMSLKEMKVHRLKKECFWAKAPISSKQFWVCKKCDQICGKTFHDWRIHVTLEHADLCYFVSHSGSAEILVRSSEEQCKMQNLVSDRDNLHVVLTTSVASKDCVNPAGSDGSECETEKMTAVECADPVKNQNTSNSFTIDSQKDEGRSHSPTRNCDSSSAENSSEVPYQSVFKLPAIWPVLMYMTAEDSPQGQCMHCGLILRNERKREHVKNHIKKRRICPKVVCEICGKDVSRDAMKIHMLKHSDNKGKTPCEICGAMILDIKAHVARHQTEAQRNVSCQYCHKQYKSQYLERHIRRVHYGQKEKKQQNLRKEFSCPICPYKSVTTKSVFKLHMNSHTKEKLYKCDICSKEFTSIVDLRTHKVVHEERKHECPEEGCGLKFRQKCTLKRHLVIHSREKPHKCKWCDASFAQSYPLSIHIKKKHSEHHEDFLAADGKRRVRKDRFGREDNNLDYILD